MDYNDIIKYLKRYSFSSKMGICQKYSSEVLTPTGIIPIEELRKRILPWELETFVLFAIEAEEYNDMDIFSNKASRFIEVMKAIRARTQTSDLKNSGTKNLVVEMLMRLGLTQFDLQEYQDYKFYRYNYFFNYQNEENRVDIKKEFFEKFGVDYNNIMMLGISLKLCFCFKNISSEMINFVISYYGKAVLPLLISRDKYIELLKTYAKNSNDYTFCVRPSYSYSFIMDFDGDIHLPLPHLLYRATTAALLYRLTDGNDLIRDNIGRYVVESYLLKILATANIYEEVLPENKYLIKGIEQKTPDVSIRSGGSFLFIESKSSVPPASIRWLNEETNSKYVENIAKAVNQLYKQIKRFANGEFYFFSDKMDCAISIDNIWGIVSLLEDSFIFREVVYNEFARIANISIEGEEYKWVINHIKVVSLYDIEKFTFIRRNIIDELQLKATENQPYDFSLADVRGEGLLSPDISEFMDIVIKDYEEMAVQMGKAGILS